MKCDSCIYFKKKTEMEQNNARSFNDAVLGVCKRFPAMRLKIGMIIVESGQYGNNSKVSL